MWLLWSKEMSSWTIWKQSRLSIEALKRTCRFRWLIVQSRWSCPVGVFYNVCFGCFGGSGGFGWLATNNKTLSAHVLAASNHVKEDRREVEILFCAGIVLSLSMQSSYFLSGASGNFYTFKNLFYFINFLFLFFLTPTSVSRVWTHLFRGRGRAL